MQASAVALLLLYVGGGLPPIAVGQLTDALLMYRHRGQAPSHILNLSVPRGYW